MGRGQRALVALPVVAALTAAALLAENAAGSMPFGDPSTHERLGIEQGQAASSVGESREALAHLLRSLELRPTSPYAWASLAEAKYRVGVADETFQVALRRAAELGPNEPAVQETVALYGLAVWQEVGPQTRSAIDGIVAAGLARDPEAMMQIANRRGRLDAACRHVGATSRIPEKWAHLCKDTGA